MLRRYPEYIKFRKPMQLIIGVLAWLPMARTAAVSGGPRSG